MADETSTAAALPGVETPAPATPRRRRKAAEKAEPAKDLTEYVVLLQKIFETAEGEIVEAWEDFGVQPAHSGPDACRRAHNGRVDPEEGQHHYRAFPVRSDSKLTATVEVKPVSLFSSSNGSAAG
jgi:hypothetical protein